MLLLTLKVLLAPLLVAGGSAAQQRWGQAVGGRLVGLPLTSLPLLFILVVADGARFAATAAAATLAGVAGQAVLTWTYARVARRHGPLATLGAAVGSFALTAAVLALLAPGPVAGAVLATLVLAFLLHFWPASPSDRARRTAAPDRAAPSGRHSTLLRMVLAAAFSLAVSELAGPLGPNLAGLVTALPVLSLVMFALTQRDDGAVAAMEFSHGVQRGSFSVVTALLVLALALPTGHVVLAFASAIIASVLAQVVAGVAEHHADPAGRRLPPGRRAGGPGRRVVTRRPRGKGKRGAAPVVRPRWPVRSAVPAR